MSQVINDAFDLLVGSDSSPGRPLSALVLLLRSLWEYMHHHGLGRLLAKPLKLLLALRSVMLVRGLVLTGGGTQGYTCVLILSTQQGLSHDQVHVSIVAFLFKQQCTICLIVFVDSGYTSRYPLLLVSSAIARSDKQLVTWTPTALGVLS